MYNKINHFKPVSKFKKYSSKLEKKNFVKKNFENKCLTKKI